MGEAGTRGEDYEENTSQRLGSSKKISKRRDGSRRANGSSKVFVKQKAVDGGHRTVLTLPHLK